MPYFELVGTNLMIKASLMDSKHHQDISQSLTQQRFREDFTDVTFHCENGDKIRANKLVLAYCSDFVKELIGIACKCCGGARCGDMTNLSLELVSLQVKYQLILYIF